MSQATASRQGQALNPSAAQLAVAPVGPFPSRLAVGRGQAFFVDGTCSHPTRRIQSLQVRLGDRSQAVIASGMPRPAATIDSDYWWAIVTVPPTDEPRTEWIELVATLDDGSEATAALGTIDLVPDLEGPVGVSSNGQPRRRADRQARLGPAPCGRLHGHLRPSDRPVSAPDRLDSRADAPQLGLPDQRRRLEPRQARGDARGPGRRSTPAAVGGRTPRGLLPQLRAGALDGAARGRLRGAQRPGRLLAAGQAGLVAPGSARGRPARVQRHANRRRGRRGDLRHLLELQAEQPHRFRRARDGQYRDRRGPAVRRRAPRRTCCRSRPRPRRATTTTGSPRSRWRSAGSATWIGRSTTTCSTGARPWGTSPPTHSGATTARSWRGCARGPRGSGSKAGISDGASRISSCTAGWPSMSRSCSYGAVTA